MKIHELFAYLVVKDAGKAIEYYETVFGAKELFRLVEPGGRVGHAELDFGGTTVMLSEEYPEHGLSGPLALAGTPVTIHLHVDDADDFIRRAAAAGAEILQPPQDHFYGERSGNVRDPFGHRWNIGHHIEDVTPEEMQRRYTELMKAGV
jgi:uncharacterized glyoxalase superfamily protein PhnB